jgi:hypothetical protein
VVEFWSSKSIAWVRFLPPLLDYIFSPRECFQDPKKQDRVTVIRRAHDPKMLVRFQLLLSSPHIPPKNINIPLFSKPLDVKGEEFFFSTGNYNSVGRVSVCGTESQWFNPT